MSFFFNCTAPRVPPKLLPFSRLAWLAPGEVEVAAVSNATFLALTFDPVRVQASGEYTCSLMIESDLLDGGRITVTAVLDLQVQGKQPLF